MPIFDDAWRIWLADNIARGCSPASMQAAMEGAGFDRATAQGAIQAALSPAKVVSAPRGYQYDAMPIAAGNRIDVGDREVQVVMRCEQPQVVVFADFLSHEECDEVIARSRQKLARSTTVNPLTGEEDVIERRTSQGTFFGRCEDEFITRLDRRVSRLMQWPLEHGEGLQILHYELGGEYRPHFDYFPPEQAGSALHLAQGGQRVATLIVYLNDVAGGGETIFPEAKLAVSPRKGAAVYFRYCNGQGQLDPLTLHGGEPVASGEKWIMTKWMRQQRYG
ncbi:prolyl 4-hydroxylase family protein [Chitinimonas naiadis]